MEILKKSPVAITIMIIAILLSGLLGCRHSLLRERKAAEDYFYNGSDGDGYSIQSDLEYIGATANNLKTVAVRYIDSADPLITALTEARGSLSAAKNISEKYTAASNLFDAVSALHDSLDESKMNSTDKGFRSSLYDDIKSAMQRISHNGYNDAARDFNSILEGFPAKFVAKLTGINQIQLYG